MILRAQFWIRFRGRVDVFINTKAGTADQLARLAVEDALLQYNLRWPCARRDELHLVGGEKWPRSVPLDAHVIGTDSYPLGVYQ